MEGDVIELGYKFELIPARDSTELDFGEEVDKKFRSVFRRRIEDIDDVELERMYSEWAVHLGHQPYVKINIRVNRGEPNYGLIVDNVEEIMKHMIDVIFGLEIEFTQAARYV